MIREPFIVEEASKREGISLHHEVDVRGFRQAEESVARYAAHEVNLCFKGRSQRGLAQFLNRGAHTGIISADSVKELDSARSNRGASIILFLAKSPVKES